MSVRRHKRSHDTPLLDGHLKIVFCLICSALDQGEDCIFFLFLFFFLRLRQISKKKKKDFWGWRPDNRLSLSLPLSLCSNNMLLVNVWICLMIMISQQEPLLKLFPSLFRLTSFLSQNKNRDLYHLRTVPMTNLEHQRLSASAEHWCISRGGMGQGLSLEGLLQEFAGGKRVCLCHERVQLKYAKNRGQILIIFQGGEMT